MDGKDNIKELFSKKLGNYEAKVNPELWAKISTQVAVGASTTVATGLSLFAKVAIGIGVSAAAITTVVMLSNSGEEVVSKKQIIEVRKSTPNANTVQAKKVTKAQTQETVKSTELRSVRKDLTNTTSNVTVGSIPVTATLTTQGSEQTQTLELPITGMSTRQAASLNDEISEPQIVEGVSYIGMTNYGGAPTNDSEIPSEVIAPRAEAVKRYVNVFTPNGDKKNDYFFLESEGLTDFSIVVFDPAGEIAFQSNNPDFKWDGRDIRTGEIVQSGTYMYMVSAYDSEGNPYPIYERLTVNR